MGIDLSILDENGTLIDYVNVDNVGARVGDDIELLRGDLNQVLYEATVSNCNYILGDSIQFVQENKDGISIELLKQEPRTFDILVGADGLHSNVRSKVFGDESLFSHNLGDYYFAICSVETALNLDQHQFVYSKIGKLVNVYCLEGTQDAKVLFVFQAPGLNYNYRDIQQQKEIVSTIFSDAVWEVPAMLKSMNNASDFYLDEVIQIRMNKWFKGRTVLIGDAAYSPCLVSGQGSGLALVGAYILAGELMLAHGDYRIAFAAYQKAMSTFVDNNQKIGKAIIGHMIPNDKVEPWIGAPIFDQIQSAANSITLKNY